MKPYRACKVKVERKRKRRSCEYANPTKTRSLEARKALRDLIAHLHAQPIPDDLAFTITRVLCERVVERVIVHVVGQVSYEESEPGY